MPDDLTDDPQQAAHPDRIVSQGYGQEVKAARGLPQGFDAEASGVGDAVPTVPSDNPIDVRPGAGQETHGLVSREHSDE